VVTQTLELEQVSAAVKEGKLFKNGVDITTLNMQHFLSTKVVKYIC
jgi:hypothetical protein